MPMLNVARHGPLAEIDRLLDTLAERVDVVASVYPEIRKRLRHLEAIVRWEIVRLEWEVAFTEAGQADREKAARAARRKDRRYRAALHAAELRDGLAQTPYEPEG